eukprot:scaffold1248_cov393-Prasinococcus_capsulatus_cf.AAC.30
MRHPCTYRPRALRWVPRGTSSASVRRFRPQLGSTEEERAGEEGPSAAPHASPYKYRTRCTA